MAGVFLRLRLALMRNRIRSSRLPSPLLWTLSALLAISAAGSGFATGGLVSAGETAWFPSVATALFACWLVGPLAIFGVDETLDPARLATLPLTPPQLMTGLLAAATLSFGGVLTGLYLLGPVFSATGTDGTVPGLMALAAIVLWLQCLAVARAVTTGLSRLLRSPRGRDLAITLSIVLTAVFYVLTQLPNLLGEDDLERAVAAGATFDPASLWPILSWTPPGQAGRALHHAAVGELGPTLLWLGLAVVSLVAMVALWWLALRRLQEVPATVSSADRTPSTLLPRWLAWMPGTRTTAVLARDLRYIGRDGARRARMIQASVFLFIPAIQLFTGSFGAEELVLLSAVSGIIAFNESSLQFGADADRLWVHIAASGSFVDDLRGRNLAGVVTVAPAALVVGIVISVLTGGWHLLPVGVVLAVAISFLAVSAANVMAVHRPYQIPDMSKGNAFGVGNVTPGQGCAIGLYSMGLFLGVAALAAPLLLIAWFRSDRAEVLVATCLVSLLGSVAVWVRSTDNLGRRADARAPEILEIVRRA